MFDVVIIGAGPAGLFSAAEFINSGLSVCILEANKTAGKKLLITGQGKCNITNNTKLPDFIDHYGGIKKKRFVRKCLYSFSNSDLICFFEKLGLGLITREDGKVFPETEKASDVLNCLLRLLKKSDTEVFYERRVSEIHQEDGSFIVKTSSETSSSELFYAGNVIIAAGGFTFPTTGSNGDGFRLAASLGHTVVPPRPALSAVIAENESFKSFDNCAGISISCSIKPAGSRNTCYTGRLLFTHTGLSGPVIIDNSRDFHTGDSLILNLLPGYSAAELEEHFIRFCAEEGKSFIKSFFTGLELPSRLVENIFNTAGAGGGRLSSLRAAETSAVIRKKLIAAFNSAEIKIKTLEGRNKAMCTAGGVDISELNAATMESRLVEGLYFAGEVIDIDGDSGGYNLQFAFSSAKAAASAVVKKLSDG